MVRASIVLTISRTETVGDCVAKLRKHDDAEGPLFGQRATNIVCQGGVILVRHSRVIRIFNKKNKIQMHSIPFKAVK
jgi:hypothetical protein